MYVYMYICLHGCHKSSSKHRQERAAGGGKLDDAEAGGANTLVNFESLKSRYMSGFCPPYLHVDIPTSTYIYQCVCVCVRVSVQQFL